MEIPDLAFIPGPPYGHAAKRYPVPDETLWRAVGWLETHVPSTDTLSQDELDRVTDAYDAEAVFGDSAGCHSCHFCSPEQQQKDGCDVFVVLNGRRRSAHGTGSLILLDGETGWVVPRMLLHYIVAHRYCPPSAFRRALCNGHFVTPERITRTFVPRGRSMPVLGYLAFAAINLLWMAVLAPIALSYLL